MLSEERQGQIALMLLKKKLKEEGIRTLKPNEIKRQIGNNAKEIGIDPTEAKVFARELVIPLVLEAFPDF